MMTKGRKKPAEKTQWFLQENRGKIEEATSWNHPGALSILRFNVPVLLLLRLVSRVS